MNKKILVAIPVTLLALGAMSGNVFAQTRKYRDDMVSKLSAKLGISETQVQKAFDELRTERQSEMQKSYLAKLSQAVADGKITEEQKSKIVAKHEELLKQKESSDWQNLTFDERKAKMEQLKTDMEKWALDNNIDMSYLMGFGQGFGRHGNR